jgi:hypothetical protein
MTAQPLRQSVVAPLVFSCSGILLVAALAKLWTAATDLGLLEVADPVMVVKNRYALMGVATVELICVATLLISRQVWFKGLLLVWLAVNFGLYRAALLLSGAGAPCPCFGGLAARLGLRASETDLLTKAAVVYLLLVGGYLLLQHWARFGNKEAVAEIVIPNA